MNLRNLKTFHLAAKLKSISKVAEALHFTQPGISLQIQALEEELGETLLIRSNKGVELTEAGEVLLDYADTILSIQDNIKRDFDNIKTKNEKLLLGACRAIGEYALPCSIYTYKQDRPDVDINLKLNNTQNVIKNLTEKAVNIGIVQGRVERRQIQTEIITSDRLILVRSASTRSQEQISQDELKQLPLILRERGSGVRKTIKEYLAKINIGIESLKVIYELDSMEAIKSSVMSGKGISFLQKLAIQRELRDETLKEIKIDGLKMYSKFHIAYRYDHQLKVLEKEFIDFIKSSKRGFC